MKKDPLLCKHFELPFRINEQLLKYPCYFYAIIDHGLIHRTLGLYYILLDVLIR